MNNDLMYKDFELFSRALIVSRDVDPVYPLLKDIIEEYKFEPEWFVFCYVMFYSLESAIIMCDYMPKKELWNEHLFRRLRTEGKLKKFGHERRGQIRNIEIQVRVFREIVDFVEGIERSTRMMTNTSLNNNRDFRDGIESISHHGGWASFKIAEIFEKSLGYEALRIPDLGLDGRDPNSTDGPVSGLRWLYGRDNKYTKDIFSVWNRFGANLAKAWGTDIGEVETCFCKWHKMMTGKYYIGHDIAEFVELKEIMEEKIYDKLMRKNFRPQYWFDVKEVDKKMKKSYMNTGGVMDSGIAHDLPQIDVFEILMNTK